MHDLTIPMKLEIRMGVITKLYQFGIHILRSILFNKAYRTDSISSFPQFNDEIYFGYAPE